MDDAARRPDRILLALVGVVAVLVVVALAVVFTRGEPAPLDQASPAGVVQRYSRAVIDGDIPTAETFLTPGARSRCYGSYSGEPRPARIVLISTTERTDSATVRVSIVQSPRGGPFGPSEYEMEDAFSLLKVNGQWMIDQAPYPLMACTAVPAKP
ncbi:hypothetical protein DC347_12565 [Pseudarthrobacter sp. AG30]|uniref:hypothetical protein n=1 Tax=Micrococcaceae TaxID=1268 RepID=UPI000379351B|nr:MULTISPECIES: hypothetical protein [Micrococcaceae]RAX16623.1 hypothetical protein DC347_12565 [Pseudarthrobacter sp. AG30]TDT79317.1 hypothetical protein DFO47_105113 [Arthrobacter sp. AG258]